MDTNHDLIVTVKQGKLKGKINKSSNGKLNYSFSGIPYAEAPEGKLRFKDPVPKASWEGIRDATKEGSIAAQCDLYTKSYSGSDDCLFVNVFTPNLNPPNPLPVMAMIHGGGFVCGSGNYKDFGPEHLIEKDVVYASFNYRLGVMGYLCTDPVNARGDMGLKDQSLALRWVKENIENFGGDSNNITIFGISAGSAAVEYQILSPMSRNLFNKAIMQSGSVLNNWARTRGAVEHAKRLAKLFGYTSDGTEGLFDFINKIDTESLVKATMDLMNLEDLKVGKFAGMGFTPAVNEFEEYDGFLNEEPEVLLRDGKFSKVPMISGFCEKEGMFLYELFFKNCGAEADMLDSKFCDYMPPFLNKIPRCDDKLRSIYKKKPEDENELDYIYDFLSDMGFIGGIFYSLDCRLEHNINEYLYRFTYDGNLNMLKKIAGYKDLGACHGDDTAYLFETNRFVIEKITAEDLAVRSRMVKMWTDFAKTGCPTPDASIGVKWLPMSKNEIHYLEIGRDLTLRNDLIPERRNLWLKLYNTKEIANKL